MPSNPVDEAHEDYINRRVAFAEENWRTYLNEKPILVSGARAHEISYSFGVLVGQDFVREQERSRYEGLLARLVNEASFYRSCIASGERLNDEDNARWLELTLDGFGVWASNRAALTPSAPAEKEG